MVVKTLNRIVAGKTCLVLLIVTLVTTLPVMAQFSYRRTIGDETENQYQPGYFTAARYRGGIISSPIRLGRTTGDGFLTRHSRFGNETGIGGSTLQTQSVTSESQPALIRPSTVSLGTALIGRPNLSVRFESPFSTPALQTLRLRSPVIGDDENARKPETFTNSPVPLTFRRMEFSSQTDNFEFGQE